MKLSFGCSVLSSAKNELYINERYEESENGQIFCTVTTVSGHGCQCEDGPISLGVNSQEKDILLPVLSSLSSILDL